MPCRLLKAHACSASKTGESEARKGVGSDIGRHLKLKVWHSCTADHELHFLLNESNENSIKLITGIERFLEVAMPEFPILVLSQPVPVQGSPAPRTRTMREEFLPQTAAELTAGSSAAGMHCESLGYEHVVA